MYTHKRLHVLVVLSLILVPLATATMLATVTVQDLDRAEDELSDAVESAKKSYRSRLSVAVQRSRSEKVIAESAAKLQALAAKKREVRLQVAALHDKLQLMHNDAAQIVIEQQRSKRLYQEELDRFTDFVHFTYARRLTASSAGPRI